MELIDAIKKRRSIRKFKPDPVPDELINRLLEAARLAPSGSNLQPWRFVVVKSKEARKKLSQATPLTFVTEAPVILACCVDTTSFKHAEKRMRELKEVGAFLGTALDELNPDEFVKRRTQDKVAMMAYLGLNAAIAIDHITLRAVDLGLGSCWVMMFDQDKAKEALELDEKYQVVALLPVGYPAQNPKPRPRIPLEEIIIKEI